MTPAEMIDKYIKLRNKIEQIRDAHKKQLAPFAEVQAQLETRLLDHLNRHDLQSVAGADGTAFKSTQTSVTVQDWALTLEHIKSNELWDLLEARVAKTAAVQAIEEAGEPIPGVKVTQAVVVRVRAS